MSSLLLSSANFSGCKTWFQRDALQRVSQTCTRYWNKVTDYRYRLLIQNVTKYATRYCDSKWRRYLSLKVNPYFLDTSNSVSFSWCGGCFQYSSSLRIPRFLTGSFEDTCGCTGIHCAPLFMVYLAFYFFVQTAGASWGKNYVGYLICTRSPSEVYRFSIKVKKI